MSRDASYPHISIGRPFSEASLVARKRGVLGGAPDSAVCMSGDWIKLHRRLQEHPWWSAEPFTRMQAWIDIIMSANYKDSTFFVRGVRVDVRRGQVAMSEEGMARRWRWSRGKVRRFLNELEMEQQIVQQDKYPLSLIDVVNYDLYQSDGTANGTTSSTTESPQTDTSKKVKKNKNHEHTSVVDSSSPDVVGAIAPSTKTPKEYAVLFFSKDPETMKAEAEFFLQRGAPLEVVRDQFLRFKHYWTELTPGGKKQRWETERTFEVRRRLVTWFDRAQKDYAKKGGSLTMPDFRSPTET